MNRPKRHERPEPRSFEEWVRRAPGARVTRKELETMSEPIKPALPPEDSTRP